jgi:hypothetical protein
VGVFLKYFLFLEIYQNNICLFKKIIQKYKKKIFKKKNQNGEKRFIPKGL